MVSVRVVRRLRGVAPADGALLGRRGGDGEDERLGRVGGGGAAEGGEAASSREEDVVVLDLRLARHGEEERVFCGGEEFVSTVGAMGQREEFFFYPPNNGLPISSQAYTMPCAGPDVPGALAYRCLAVKQSSNFFLCGAETEISLISSSTSSCDASAPLARGPAPLAAGPSSTRLRFAAGSEFVCSWSWTKLAMLLKRVILAGESAKRGVRERSMQNTHKHVVIRTLG